MQYNYLIFLFLLTFITIPEEIITSDETEISVIIHQLFWVQKSSSPSNGLKIFSSSIVGGILSIISSSISGIGNPLFLMNC